MTTAAAVAKALADAGIERVFGLPGGEVLVLIDELRKAGIDFVLMRHEANAGLAAAVYGKLRGQPGVVLATLGPGAANLLLPVSSAYLDQEPCWPSPRSCPASCHPATLTSCCRCPRFIVRSAAWSIRSPATMPAMSSAARCQRAWSVRTERLT